LAGLLLQLVLGVLTEVVVVAAMLVVMLLLLLLLLLLLMLVLLVLLLVVALWVRSEWKQRYAGYSLAIMSVRYTSRL
jgi:hypothetical protein